MLKLESYVSGCTDDAESHVVWRVGVHGLKLSNLVWCDVITSHKITELQSMHTHSPKIPQFQYSHLLYCVKSTSLNSFKHKLPHR